jgi:hypothetical protein
MFLTEYSRFYNDEIEKNPSLSEIYLTYVLKISAKRTGGYAAILTHSNIDT